MHRQSTVSMPDLANQILRDHAALQAAESRRSAELQARVERIAVELAAVYALQQGQEPSPFDTLPPAVQQRYRRLARRAVIAVESQKVLDAMEAAVEKIQTWNEAFYRGEHPPSVREIAAEALRCYEGQWHAPDADETGGGR